MEEGEEEEEEGEGGDEKERHGHMEGREWGQRLKVAIADAMDDCHVESHVALSLNGISWHIIYLPRICHFFLRSLLHVTTTHLQFFPIFHLFYILLRLFTQFPYTTHKLC